MNCNENVKLTTKANVDDTTFVESEGWKGDYDVNQQEADMDYEELINVCPEATPLLGFFDMSTSNIKLLASNSGQDVNNVKAKQIKENSSNDQDSLLVMMPNLNVHTTVVPRLDGKRQYSAGTYFRASQKSLTQPMMTLKEIGFFRSEYVSVEVGIDVPGHPQPEFWKFNEIVRILQKSGIKPTDITFEFASCPTDSRRLRQLFGMYGYQDILPPINDGIYFIPEIRKNLQDGVPAALEVIFPLLFPDDELNGQTHRALPDAQITTAGDDEPKIARLLLQAGAV
ncbi:MAG: hypothetical protein Q9164_001331 [Protoblastenia rupestris]